MTNSADDARENRGGPEIGSASNVSETVAEIRNRIAALADSDGAFVVACRESGLRPEPVDDVRFERYDDAEAASELAWRYRNAMRTIDPSLSEYDLAVSEATDETVEIARVRERTDSRRENGLPRSRQTVTLAGNGSDEWLRVENGPVVEFTGPDSLLDDEFVTRQLNSKLTENQ